MKTLTIRNITTSPQAVNTLAGRVVVEPRAEAVTHDFDDGEAKNIEANTFVFTTGEAAKLGVNTAASSAHAVDLAVLRDQRDKAQTELAAIAALFGTDVAVDQVRGKVEALIAQIGSGGGDKKPTLAEAVLLLDDAKDDDWTSGGKPSIDALEKLTGGKPTRHDVDALVPARVRKV